MAIRAVVVEEDPFLLEAVCDFLEGCGVDVVVRARGKDQGGLWAELGKARKWLR